MHQYINLKQSGVNVASSSYTKCPLNAYFSRVSNDPIAHKTKINDFGYLPSPVELQHTHINPSKKKPASVSQQTPFPRKHCPKFSYKVQALLFPFFLPKKSSNSELFSFSSQRSSSSICLNIFQIMPRRRLLNKRN